MDTAVATVAHVTDERSVDHTGPIDLSTQYAASTDEVAAMYDEWADSYDADLDAWGYVVPETIAVMLASPRLPDGEILDAGCGTGRSGVALQGVGATNVLGVDLSPASLDVAARRRVYSSTLSVDLKQPLPLATDRFAAAISAGVFSYLGDPDPVVRELVRVVRPGGRVIFSQRTDLWTMYDCDAVVARLVTDGSCDADISDPQPYLPRHPEFADRIQVVYTSLTVHR